MSDAALPDGPAGDRVGLSDQQQKQLLMVLAALEDDEHAPTSVRASSVAAEVHIADSLSALELGAVRAAARLADLGSGAGFPGVALAVALPSATVSLLESRQRKCEFLERLCAGARIGNAEVVCGRAELWRAGRDAHDIVTARALAPQPVVLEYAAPLLRRGGSLVDWRGRRVAAEEQSALRAAAELGLERVEVRRVVPYAGVRDHHLHVFVKAAETPERFPRRVGMARKRPLG